MLPAGVSEIQQALTELPECFADICSLAVSVNILAGVHRSVAVMHVRCAHEDLLHVKDPTNRSLCDNRLSN